MTVIYLSALNIYSQNDRFSQKARNRMESMRIGIITSRLNLTPEEAEKFWPVYNEYRKKLDNVHLERMQIIESLGTPGDSLKTLSDVDSEKILANILRLTDEYARIQADYYNKFKKLIGPQRSLDLYFGEIQFKRAIVKELQGRYDRRQD